jgi:large subunit ribosomal protein L18
MANKQIKLKARRSVRSRFALKNKSRGRVRLSVFRSSQHIYAQIIDDAKGKTIAAASTLDEGLKDLKTGANIEAAKAVGKLIAERAKEKQIAEVVFDRGRFIYHGRVKALAEAAREAGLSF